MTYKKIDSGLQNDHNGLRNPHLLVFSFFSGFIRVSFYRFDTIHDRKRNRVWISFFACIFCKNRLNLCSFCNFQNGRISLSFFCFCGGGDALRHRMLFFQEH